MTTMNPKLYGNELKVTEAGQAARMRSGVSPVGRLAQPVASIARNVRDTCAVIVDAIRGRYDR